MQNDPQSDGPGRHSPDSHSSVAEPRDAIFTGIMWIMIANVLVGALLMIVTETMNLPPAVGQTGLGLALVCGGVYFFFRWFQRKEAKRRAGENSGFKQD